MRAFSDAYDHKFLRRCMVFIALTAALLMVTRGSGAALFPLFAVMALISVRPEWVVFVILLFIAATVGNPYFMSKGMVFGIAERAALFLVAIMAMTKASGRQKSKFVSPLLFMFLYVLWMCLSSAGGWSPMVSYLKLLLFSVIYLSFYAASNLVITDRRTNPAHLRSVVLSIACFFVIGSFCLIPFPSIGMMGYSDFTASQLAKGDFQLSLFKGMTMHSQSLGPIIAATSTYLFADLVFSIKKWDPLYVCMLLMSPLLVYKTSSRTAMGSYIAGMGMVTWLLLQSRGVGRRWKGKVLNVVFSLITLGAVSVLAVPSIRESAMTFILKFHKAEVNEAISVDDVISSRQGLMDNAMYNFRNKPLQGNGFQVSPEMQFEHRSGLTDYLTAPVEKGVWVTAILEEGGAVGFGIFIIFILYALFKFYALKAYCAMSVLVVLLVSNLGEFTIFSMSYTGGYIWSLVFAACVMDAQREKDAKRARMMPFGNYGW